MRRELSALSGDELDLVVVGGGIYGVAAAWDAAQRGLAVGLVERDDFGAGTSWNSLKTLHGGMRYLQRAGLRRLRESSRERRALLRIAPEVVRPLRFVVPTYGHGLAGREALSVALRVNDWLTWDRNRALPASRHIPSGRVVSAGEALELVPGLDRAGVTGAAVWTEAQATSTERLTLGFVLAAAAAGARVANHAEVVEPLVSGGRIRGVAVRDRLGGGTVEVRSRMVLNAAGPWADELSKRAGVPRPPAPLLRARNLVLEGGKTLPHAVGGRSRGRFLFIVPWAGRTMVGTDYEPADTEPSDPRDFLDEAVRAFPWASLDAATVTLVHEGRVPGRGGASGLATRPRLHDHEAEDGIAGLVGVQGVKYTTARAVAERAIDLVMRRLQRAPVACRTATTLLPGARPLRGPLESRTREAVRDEMALTLADATLRRLDLGTAGAPSEEDLSIVCGVMAEELGWDDERQQRERETVRRLYPPW